MAGAIYSVYKKSITFQISFARVEAPSSLASTTVYYPAIHPASIHWTPAMHQALLGAGNIPLNETNRVPILMEQHSKEGIQIIFKKKEKPVSD